MWKLEEVKSKQTKVPYQINGKKANATNLKTWTSYDKALNNFELGKTNGIGFVLTDNDPFTCIDLDNCIQDGVITSEVKALVDTIDSYTEYSQSGNGLHIWVKGKKPGTRSKNSKKGIEIYDNKRFIIMTGNHVEGTPLEIIDRQDILDYIYDSYFGTTSENVKPGPKMDSSDNSKLSSPKLSDQDVINIASKAKNGDHFKALYSGEYSAYGSQSEADIALCNIIAFYTQDMEQIDRIFSSSGLYREKWDREDYKTWTIQKAVNSLTTTYQKTSSSNDSQLQTKGITIPKPYSVGKNGMLYEIKTKKVDGMDMEVPVFVSRKTPFLTKEFHNVEYNQLFYEIEWEEPYGTVREVVPASTISSRRELLELSNKGFSVNDNNVKHLIQYLDTYQAYNSVEKFHAVERIGKIKGKVIHPLMNDNVEIISIDHGEKQLLEAFQVKGTSEEWKREVFERIKDSPKAVFMLLASFASVIISDLKVPPFIVELYSGTSQGKTTVLRIICTVWGNSRDFLNYWHSTNVGIERKSAFLNSFPFIIDDTKNAADEKILKSAIYQFSTGRSKGRGSLKGSQREYTWQNIMLSTGEVSLNEYVRNHGGAAARIIPLSGQPLKRDFDNVDKLERAIEEYHGAIGIDFLNVWNQCKDDFIPEYHKFKSYYVKKAKDNDVLARIANYYASIHFTGSVLKEKLGLDIDLKAISTLFDEMAEENKNTDKAMQFLEDILMDLDSDRNAIRGLRLVHNNRMKAIYVNDTKQLYLMPQYLKEFLKTETSQIRGEWLRRGITVASMRNGKETDGVQFKHKGEKFRAIPLNMEVVNELGFDFHEEISQGYPK
ncbi:protein of unknown function [Halolactibacillus halophilus]|uniref:Uncharacterized protein n=1 Tax=Halolactibacillus halophilus TaxID=306540 RepID=A0A1I5Q1G2_9BACI|nr:DUF927 domain-containing protein [Halolactibacillus halophilus]GEM01933.1 hypothetical protein HHA03_14650 [Halolactibacillus halophilus]SFP39870.1 protein of unknown function [Halolactibacillus halophilus]